MFKHAITRRSCSAILLIVMLALSACSAVQPIATDTTTATPSAAATTVVEATTPSAPPSTPATSGSADASTTSNTDPDQIMASIQETLDLYAEAYNGNKPELFTQIVDPKNGPMKRFVQGDFETYQNSIFGGGTGFQYTVNDIEKREHGFVMATVEANGNVGHWTFRNVDGKWLMSEPNQQQLGERQKVETEHFIFHMYPWTEAVNQTLMKQMETAREQVLAKLGKVPDKKANVYIKPTFGVGEKTGSNTLAFYTGGSSRAGDKMVIVSPQSYVYSFYDPNVGWESQLQIVLTHEYAHLVNNRLFTPIARMSDWMFEGIAEFVADHPRPSEVSVAVRSGNIIPIIDTSGQINKQDLEHLTILEQDISLAYGLSYELVEFINERHGGMDGFWKLTESFDKTQKLDTALQQAFGIGYDQFDREWREWLAIKYGG